MQLKTSTQVRLGKIEYLNTLPFYYGFCNIEEDCELIENVPSEINRLMQKEAVDLAPISSLEYARHPELYYLLPKLCIGSKQLAGSVLLFSRQPIQNLEGKRIAISAESYSSQALIQILLKERFGFSNTFVEASGEPSAMLEKADACLSIGDKALFHEPKTFTYKYDLGELWTEWKSKPFCFSVWAVRRKFYDENSAEITAFWRALCDNAEINLQNLKSVIYNHLGIDLASPRFAPILSYLSQLSYCLDPDMQEGLLEFYRLAHQFNFISSVPELEFVPGEK